MLRVRKFLILLCAAGFIASTSAWIGLKIGRPVYYSDGDESVSAFDLQESSMLRWAPPEPECEIPGPVRGRVTELPDGRLIYGRVRGPRSTDLVVYDPEHPGTAPQPVIELNSPGHDFAPALGPSNRLYFASDRTSGGGGFDIYRATYRDGIFFGVHRLPDGINSGLDETDPTIDRMGGQLAFVRRDPDVELGRNGRLMVVPLGAPEDVVPVFYVDEQPSGRRLSPPIDRDPVFAPDGIGLYFVRETYGQPLALMRTFWHRDHYVDPMVVEALQDGGPFRAPAFVSSSARSTGAKNGIEIRLVAPSEPAVIHRARAEEIYPFFEGQHWLEALLLSLIAFFALLMVLLSLGARWKQLDTITKLLLLSLLIHLLLLLWFSSMEIIRSFTPKGPAAGSVEVHLLSQSASRADSGSTDGAVRQEQTDVSQALSFRGNEEALVSGRPGLEVESAERSLEGAEVVRASYTPTQPSREASLSDQTEQPKLRSTVASEADHARRELKTEADRRNNTRANRSEVAAEKITVVVPGSATEFVSGPKPSVARRDRPEPPRALPAPRRVPRRAVSVEDALPSPAVRANRLAEAGAAARLRVAASAAQSVPKRVVGQSLARAASAERSVLRATQAPALVQGAPQRRAVSTARAPESYVAKEMAVEAMPVAARVPALAVVRGMAATDEQSLEAPAPSASGQARQVQTGRVVAKRERPAAAAEATIVVPRTELAAQRERRVFRATRAFPEPGGSMVGVPVALNDEPGAPVDPAPGKDRRADVQRITARSLARVQPASDVVRGVSRADPMGDVARQRTKLPDSLVEREKRRQVGALDSETSESPKPRDLFAAAVSLDDRVTPQNPATTPGERKVSPPARPSRPLLTSIAQRDLPVVARPSRVLDGPGSAQIDVGILLPTSFVERAGIRTEIPDVVAAATELTPYSNRFGAKKLAALQKYGGSEATERAVRRGLAYLARIQNEDGTWGDQRRSQRKYGSVFIGKTGLCLLAFLGAGHTPASGTEHSELTGRAIAALLRTQRRSGHFGRSSAYSHGITTYALAECYALTKSPEIQEPLEDAVEWILANQNSGRDKRNRGGWGYFSSTLRPEDPYTRTSTTAWQIMALESAKLSGIEVPERAMRLAREYLLNNYDRRHRYFLYNKEPSRLRSSWRTLPASTPAAVFCLQLFGMDPVQDPRLAAGLKYTIDRRPRSYRRYSDDEFVLRGAGNVYFWYYGSLACFLAGGPQWERWNAALKKVLIRGQSRDGSFRPIDTYSNYAGDTDDNRAYTTSMCVLSLEVYYRYFTPLLKGK